MTHLTCASPPPDSICSHVHKLLQCRVPHCGECQNSEQFPHPRGDGRPSSGVPAGAQRDERRRHHDLLQPRAGGRGGRQQRQAAQGPLPPRLLRHPRRRVRRAVPPLPDLPRDRPDPGLARGRRRHRQPRPRAGQLLRLLLARVPHRRAARRRRQPARRGRRRAGDPQLRGPRGGRRRARRRHRRDRDAGRRRAGRLRPDGRGRHPQHPQLRADDPLGARGRRRTPRRPLQRAADPRLPRAAQDRRPALGAGRAHRGRG